MKPTGPITVLFDCQVFLLQRHGGISKYFAELIGAFDANPELGIRPILETESALSEHAISQLSSFNLKRVRGVRTALLSLAKLGFHSPRPEAEKPDLVHRTFYLPGFLYRHRGVPSAVTLFDMIPENTPRGFRIWNPHFLKRRFIFNSDLLLSISSSSTKDMRKRYGYGGAATTTYLGVGPEYRPNLPRPASNSNPYFLYVGNRSGYKDCQTALKAFSELTKTWPEVRLCLVGGGRIRKSELRLIRSLGISHQISQVEPSSTDLPNFYSNALALLYTTKYEGFGLPLVEAMASGLPILASDTPINREICEDVGVYFNPGSYEELHLLMDKRLTGDDLFQDKITYGLDRARGFTWIKCAEKTAIAYRSLLKID